MQRVQDGRGDLPASDTGPARLSPAAPRFGIDHDQRPMKMLLVESAAVRELASRPRVDDPLNRLHDDVGLPVCITGHFAVK